MIILTKLSGQPYMLNSELIETITENPDTTITLTSGRIYIAAESMQCIVEKIIAYKQRSRRVIEQL